MLLKTIIYVPCLIILFSGCGVSPGKEPGPVFVGGGDYDSARAVVLAGKNRYMLAGMTTSYGAGHVDVFALVVNKSGRVIRQNTYGGTGDDRGLCAVPSAGGYVIGGYTTSFGAGASDFYVLKVNEKLEPVWSKTFGYEGADECRAAATDLVNTALAGFMTMSGVQRPVIILVSPSGRLLWEREAPFLGTGIFHSAAFSPDGKKIAAAGVVKGPQAKANEAFAAVFDTATGEVLQKVLFESEGPAEAKAIEFTETGFVIAGEEGNKNEDADIVLFAADKLFAPQWKSFFGGKGTEFVSSLAKAPGGGWLITGTTESKGRGSTDAYLIRTDAAGSLIWEKTYGTKRDDYGGGSVFDGSLVITAGWSLLEDKGYEIMLVSEEDSQLQAVSGN